MDKAQNRPETKQPRSSREAGRGADPVRCVRGRHHRHADPADDREHRPARPRTTGDIKDQVPPGHADITYSRNTASRFSPAAAVIRHVKPRRVVAARRLAREAIRRLPPKVQITVTCARMARINRPRLRFDWGSESNRTRFWCPDAKRLTTGPRYLGRSAQVQDRRWRRIIEHKRHAACPRALARGLWQARTPNLAQRMMSIKRRQRRRRSGEGMFRRHADPES